MTHLETVGSLAKTKRRRVSGARLRAARDAAGISQETLARRLDVRVPTISERENSGEPGDDGAGGVSWETWLAWASVLGLDASWVPEPPKPTRRVRRKPDA